MQVPYLLLALAPKEVAVHEANGQEEGQVITLEVSQHLDHPVDHPGSEGPRHGGVLAQTVCRQEFEFLLTKISIDVLRQLHAHVDVLPFVVGSSLPGHPEGGVFPQVQGH